MLVQHGAIDIQQDLVASRQPANRVGVEQLVVQCARGRGLGHFSDIGLDFPRRPMPIGDEFIPVRHEPMELSWLEDFLAVIANGGFSRAATQRHITQPALSRRIRY